MRDCHDALTCLCAFGCAVAAIATAFAAQPRAAPKAAPGAPQRPPMEATVEGQALHAAFVKAQFGFTPEVRAAYLARRAPLKLTIPPCPLKPVNLGLRSQTRLLDQEVAEEEGHPDRHLC